jgi:hypothetical protein
MSDPYFDELMVNQMRLRWAVATRRQLERWEPLVAAFARSQLNCGPHGRADTWAAWMEHHFALVAARNLLRALDLTPTAGVSIDPTMSAEIIEGRDLHEHWPENMPVFNVSPPPAKPPRRSGKEFATRNPSSGNYPYWWLGWSRTTGPRLLPHVTAPELHELLNEIEADAVANVPSLSEYIPARAPSSWVHHNGQWWPKPSDEG